MISTENSLSAPQTRRVLEPTKSLDQRMLAALRYIKDNPDCETGDELDGNLIKIMRDDNLVRGDCVETYSASEIPFYDTLCITLKGERELGRLESSVSILMVSLVDKYIWPIIA